MCGKVIYFLRIKNKLLLGGHVDKTSESFTEDKPPEPETNNQKGKQSSSLGRKPISLTLNDKAATIAVAHIGYGELKISILDLCGAVLNTSHLRFARKSSFYTVIKMLRQHLSEML